MAWPRLDAALRGALVLLLLMMAATLGRERAREPWARVALALALGLCVQTVVNTPWIDQQVPALWLSPWVAISAGNAVLTAPQVIAHHNATLTNISSFGPQVRTIPAAAIQPHNQAIPN